MLVDDFKKIMNAVEVNMDMDGKEPLVKSEVIKDFKKGPEGVGKRGPWTRIAVVTEAGNWYSKVLDPDKAQEILTTFEPEDKVQIRYVEKPYMKDGEERIGKELVSIDMCDIDVNEITHSKPAEPSDTPLPLPTPSPDPKVRLESTTEPKKGYPGRSTDEKIAIQSTLRTCYDFVGSFPALFDTIDGAVKVADALTRTTLKEYFGIEV